MWEEPVSFPHIIISSSGKRVSREQWEQLRALSGGQKVEHRLRVRASIVWRLLVLGQKVEEVSSDMELTSKTVQKWRGRFLDKGLDGLQDAYRSGRPATFTLPERCEVIAMACDAPEHYGEAFEPSWTLNRLTKAVSRHCSFTMSRSSIARTLRENDLHPHRVKMWLHSMDPDFKEKVNAVVDLYLNPPPDTVVVCVDEKTGVQATERKCPTRPARPGQSARVEYEYIRHGTQALIAGFNIFTGKVTASCGKTRKADDLMAFMERLATQYQGQKVTVIWDNLNIHNDGQDRRWAQFNERHGNRFSFVHTPLHASWMNQVEIFFSILHKRCIRNGSFLSEEDLKRKLMAFIERWNAEEGHPFNWTFRGYPMQQKVGSS